jgi:hypothetical protein
METHSMFGRKEHFGTNAILYKAFISFEIRYQPHILQLYYKLRMFLGSDSLPFHWTFKERQKCQQLLSTG